MTVKISKRVQDIVDSFAVYRVRVTEFDTYKNTVRVHWYATRNTKWCFHLIRVQFGMNGKVEEEAPYEKPIDLQRAMQSVAPLHSWKPVGFRELARAYDAVQRQKELA